MHTFISLQKYARQITRQAIIKIESERSSSNAAFFIGIRNLGQCREKRLNMKPTVKFKTKLRVIIARGY